MWSTPGQTTHSWEKFSTQGGRAVMTNLHILSSHLPSCIQEWRRFPFPSPAKQPDKSPPPAKHQTSCGITLAPNWYLNRPQGRQKRVLDMFLT